MADRANTGRANQRRRTRKDLLEATARLLKKGLRPSLEKVAEEALVSRATAYRYFPGMEALLAEAAVDVAMPDVQALFGDERTGDPVARLERVDAEVHKVIAENEAPLRVMLAQSLERRAKGAEAAGLPIRQNRRTPLIEAALAPVRGRIAPAEFERLVAALALVIGTEAMVVLRDVLQLEDDEAQEVRRWAIRTLVETALARAAGAG